MDYALLFSKQQGNKGGGIGMLWELYVLFFDAKNIWFLADV